MLKIQKIIIIHFIAFLFSSCIGQYGNRLAQNAVPLVTDSCTNKPRNVFLFYEVEPIHFNYSKRCLVEVIGSQFTTEEELINRLKYQAYLNCANAIIGLKSYYINRETGYYNDPKSRYSYTAKVYTGLAVRMDSDSLYMSSKYGDWRNTDYLGKVQGYVKSDENEFVFKFILGTILIIAGVAYVISKA